MQRGESQMARLGYAERVLSRFKVAHFTDQHNIRILAQRRTKRVGKIVSVRVHLALIYYAALVTVEVFDRIFDGNDVLVPIAVYLINHCRQRCRLPGSSRAGHQNQPARLLAELVDHRRKTEFLKRPDLVRNRTKDRSNRAALIEYVRPEP